MRRAPRVALATLLFALPACGGKKSPPALPAPPPQAAAPAPPPKRADPAAQAELTNAVAAFSLTDAVVDGIAASDRDLADFWANPAEAQKIQGRLTLAAIVKAIDDEPRVKKTLAAHGLTGRDYTLGTFAMLGAYSYEMVKRVNPKQAEGRKPPVNAATLEVVRRRFADVERLVRPSLPPRPPGAGGAPPAPAAPR